MINLHLLSEKSKDLRLLMGYIKSDYHDLFISKLGCGLSERPWGIEALKSYNSNTIENNISYGEFLDIFKCLSDIKYNDFSEELRLLLLNIKYISKKGDQVFEIEDIKGNWIEVSTLFEQFIMDSDFSNTFINKVG